MDETHSKQRLHAALARAQDHSPFLRQQLISRPAIGALLEAGNLPAAIAEAERAGAEAANVMSAVRRERNGLALALGVGDLAGLLSLEEVVGALSACADRALEAAVRAAILARTPDAEPRGFAVIALGKLGSGELNYSSDLDVLFLFDPERLPLRPREDAGEAAVRIGQKVIEILQKRDAEGYAFRVDLRLRPSSEITPISLPVEAAISYYESSALPWERAAFIRSRFVAGDEELGRYFLEAIHPFVWRRSLDFGAIGEIQSITRRIRDHYAQAQLFGPGYDLKRGRGGIREIEFFAQIHQLIHGGREPELRAPATLDALRALSEAGRIDAGEAAVLGDAYRLFRTIEHRLQMVEDRQTHSLPAGAEEMDGVARLHGVADGAALLALLEAPVRQVSDIYGQLGEGGDEQLPHNPDALEHALREAGFGGEAGAARQRIEGWRSGKARSLRTAAALDAFEAMLPGLVRSFAAAPDPMRAMNRFDQLTAKLPSAVNLFRLLEARPALTHLLGTILSHAPTLADQLGRQPALLDSLIDATAFEPVPPVEELEEDFARTDWGGDYQALLDRVRQRVNEVRFALGAQLVLARSDPLEVAGGYARVAEAALRVLARAAMAEFEKVHGRVPGSELLILGLGRLGGEALTHASDLDLVYVFSGTHEAESDGPRPLRATDYFNRLAPRVSSALSAPTAAGPLYNVDTRLRPSGKDGMLAVSQESFAAYQRSQAWTWEHMALTRARPVFGSAEGRASLQAVIDEVLHQPREAAATIADAVRMRSEMAARKAARGPFDAKLVSGGLVDLEFAAHMLQLTRGVGLHPQLGRAIDELIAAGLAPPEIRDAHRLLTRLLVTFRIVCPDSAEPPPASQGLAARACGLDDWPSLLEAYDEARQRVSALWRGVAGLKE